MSNYARVPIAIQDVELECGATAIAMVFAYFGKIIPVSQIISESEDLKNGYTTAGSIKRSAEKWGLSCKGYSIETERLLSIDMPCILHWNYNNFVVLEGSLNGHIFINDPSCGRREINFLELDEGFTGVVLTFEVTDEFLRIKS